MAAQVERGAVVGRVDGLEVRVDRGSGQQFGAPPSLCAGGRGSGAGFRGRRGGAGRLDGRGGLDLDDLLGAPRRGHRILVGPHDDEAQQPRDEHPDRAAHGPSRPSHAVLIGGGPARLRAWR